MEKHTSYEVRSIKDLKDMLNQSAGLYGNRPAFKLKKGENTYIDVNYSAFKNDVDSLGSALLKLGMKDSFIAVIGENRYEWCTTYIAVTCGTGVIVPLDKELPLTELTSLLTRSGAKAVVFSGKHEKEMKIISNNIKTIDYFINMDAEEDNNNFLSYGKLLEKGRKLLAEAFKDYIEAVVDNKTLKILLFTSGTTDMAKGVMLSHRNICSNLEAVRQVLYLDYNDSVLSILPLHHTYECTCGFLLMIYNGCCISFAENLKSISKNLKETSPTILILVPLILESMYKKIWEAASKKKGNVKKIRKAIRASNFLLEKFHIDIRKKLFSKIHESIGGKLRLAISGAAAIDPDVSAGFRNFGIKVLQGYGLTECSPIVTVNREFDFRDASIGQLIPGMEARIEGIDNSGIGELVVKGENIMLGYFENRQATDKVLKDGWLYTGDLGKMDSDGMFYVTGRKKNVIVTKNGKNIYPEEIEAIINRSPYIMESLIFGETDIPYGEESEIHVHAQIVPELAEIRRLLGLPEDSPVPREQLFDIINKELKIINKTLPRYKSIRGFNIRNEEFSKTTTKKIKRYMEKTG